MRLALVGCGATKRDDAAPAGDLYTSPYASVKREYANTCCDAWFILSAKHGLVPRREILDPYDFTITDYPVAARDAPFADDTTDKIVMVEDWAEEVLDGVDSVLRRGDMATGEQVTEIVVLAGAKYRDPIRDGLEALTEHHEVELTSPFAERDLGGMGPQMSWMKKRVDAATKAVTDGGQEIQTVFETVDSERAARDLLDAVEPGETMLEYKVSGDSGFEGAIDTVRRFDSQEDVVQVRSFIGCGPVWVPNEQAAEELVGHPARVVDYEAVA